MHTWIMSFHIISKCVEDHTNTVDAKQQQPNPTSPVSLKSDLMALGFSGPEIDELFGAENADREEISRRHCNFRFGPSLLQKSTKNGYVPRPRGPM